MTTAVWFEGPATPDGFDLQAASGATFAVVFEDEAFSGTLGLVDDFPMPFAGSGPESDGSLIAVPALVDGSADVEGVGTFTPDRLVEPFLTPPLP